MYVGSFSLQQASHHHHPSAINKICCQDVWYQNSFYRLSPDVAQWVLWQNNQQIFQFEPITLLTLNQTWIISPERSQWMFATRLSPVCLNFVTYRDNSVCDRVTFVTPGTLQPLLLPGSALTNQRPAWGSADQSEARTGSLCRLECLGRAIKQYISIGLIADHSHDMERTSLLLR